MSKITTLLDSIFQNNGGTTKQWRQANEILLTKTDEIKKYVSYMKNKIRDLNKDTQLLALDFLDYSIDDGKMPLWTQVGSKDFLSSLVNIYKTRTEEEVQTKILYLIKKWANKFQKYNTIIPNFSSTYENLKNNDINFPHGIESTYEKYLQGPENNQSFGDGGSKPKKIKDENNNSSNKNYVKNINIDLRTSSYEKKYKRLVNKLDEWTQQIEDANVFMDLAQGGNFDDDLRGICDELESGKKQLVDTIESGKLKDEKLMEISLNVQDDIEMTLKRWEDVKNGRNPPPFNSSFFGKSGNNNRNNDNMNQNKGGLDLLGFDDNTNDNNNVNKGNNLLDVFSGPQNVNQGNNDFFSNMGNNNQNNNNNFFGNNNNQNNNNFFGNNNNQNNQNNNIDFFGNNNQNNNQNNNNNNQNNNNFFGNNNNQNNNNFFGNNNQNNTNQNNNFFGNNNNNQNNLNQNNLNQNNNDIFSQMFNNNNSNNNNISNNNFMNNNNNSNNNSISNNNFDNLFQNNNNNAFNMNNNNNGFVNLNSNLMNNQMNFGSNNNNNFNNFGFNNTSNNNNNFSNNNTFNNFNPNNNLNNKNKSNKDYVFDFKI